MGIEDNKEIDEEELDYHEDDWDEYIASLVERLYLNSLLQYIVQLLKLV